MKNVFLVNFKSEWKLFSPNIKNKTIHKYYEVVFQKKVEMKIPFPLDNRSHIAEDSHVCIEINENV